jgi:hypothetical protein
LLPNQILRKLSTSYIKKCVCGFTVFAKYLPHVTAVDQLVALAGQKLVFSLSAVAIGVPLPGT